MHILVDMPIHPTSLTTLQSWPGIRVDFLPEEPGQSELPESMLKSVDALFRTQPLERFGETERLRWIQIGSAGYAQLFGLNLPGRGIRASNARGCFDVPIAEWTIAMMVNLVRDLRQMIRNQDSQTWDRDARFQTEIRGRTLGIWGYGGIGRETARLAKHLGVRVHVMSRRGIQPVSNVYVLPGTGDSEAILPDRVYMRGQEIEFLSELDFLVLTMPLTPETEGIVGEKELRALPGSAYVLNPARGPIIQEQALLQALQQGWIAGAALDTHYAYPLPPEHPLWSFPHVILTPHISGSTLNPHFTERIWDIFLQNVRRLQSDQPLLNELSPAQLSY